MTTTEIDKQIDEVGYSIDRNRKIYENAINNITNVRSTLSAYATEYSELIAAINEYGTTDAYEATIKAKWSKLVAEYSELLADVNASAASLGL